MTSLNGNAHTLKQHRTSAGTEMDSRPTGRRPRTTAPPPAPAAAAFPSVSESVCVRSLGRLFEHIRKPRGRTHKHAQRHHHTGVGARRVCARTHGALKAIPAAADDDGSPAPPPPRGGDVQCSAVLARPRGTAVGRVAAAAAATLAAAAAAAAAATDAAAATGLCALDAPPPPPSGPSSSTAIPASCSARR